MEDQLATGAAAPPVDPPVPAPEQPERPMGNLQGDLPPPPKEVARLLLKVAGDLPTRIARRGNNEKQNYAYATEADVTAVVRPLLVKHGLAIIPVLQRVQQVAEWQTSSGSTWVTLRAWVRYTLMDVETGVSWQVIWPGDGSDNGDKALYKALTGSAKYLLLKLLWVATGDDPEEGDVPDDGKKKPNKGQPKAQADAPQGPPAPPAPSATTARANDPINPTQRARMYHIAKTAGHLEEAVNTWLAVEHGVDSATHITQGQLPGILTRLAQKKPLEGIESAE